MAEKRKTQAISLLEGILDDTRNEAEAERQRIEAELKAKEEAERQAREAEEARRRAEAEARLAAEEERRRQAAERRAAELERMRIEELKEKGLWKEPEPEPEPAPAPVAAPVPQRPQQTTSEALAVQQANQKKSKLGPVLAAAAAVVVLGGGAAAFVIIDGIEHVDASTSFAKAEAATSPLANAVAVVGFEPIPEPEIIEVEPEDTPTAAAATRPSSGSSGGSSGSSSGGSSADSGSTGPRLQLGGALRRDR